MNLETEDYFIQCDVCNKKTNIFYHHNDQKVCGNCMRDLYEHVPEFCYLPCGECKRPNVKWFMVNDSTSTCSVHQPIFVEVPDKSLEEFYKKKCEECGEMAYGFHHEIGYDTMICTKCLVSHCGGFPSGKGTYTACRKCKPPNINWYFEETYGDIKHGCHIHDPDPDSDYSNNMFD